MKTNFPSRMAATLLLASAAFLAPLPVGAAGPKTFPTAEAAMEAFGRAILDNDEAAKRAILGSDFRKAIPEQGDEARYRFIEAWVRSHRIEADGERAARIAVGDKGWTLPIPLVKADTGWRFDLKAGEREMKVRRIGRNELAVIQVMQAYVDAQREYAQVDRDGNGIPEYARQITSTPGRKDGLYWPAAAGDPSPLGRRFADAAADTGRRPAGTFHGYRYRILAAQGPAAAGGARDYVVADRMTGGFALIAWPATWGETGIMTFIINNDGIVYERNLGPDSARAVERIRAYNPDGMWRRTDNP